MGDTVAFGILSGLATVVPLIVGSIVAGITTEYFNRTMFLCTSALLWALTVLGTGFAQNFQTVLALRIILGFTQGFFFPTAVSLIIDYYPENLQ